jgi:ribosomal protein S18 acetylase RimI-like enzyme
MIAYRSATVADAALLADLFRRSFVATFAHLYSDEDLQDFLAGITEEAWARELADPAFKVRIAEDDGVAAAFAKIGPRGLPVAPRGSALELRQLYVLEPWHGAGVARALMDWVLAEARAAGADELYLSVWTDNHRAKSFYRRYGFGYVGPYKFMVGKQADEDEIWRLDLKATA